VDATTARILTAAREVFDEEGFRGATTRRIAARAGVNEVTLFRHFATKEELIAAALEHGHRQALARLAAGRLPDAPRDLAGELGAYLRMVLKAFAGSGRGVRTAMAEWEHLPAYHGWLLGPSDAVMAELLRYLEAARAAGLTRPDVDLRAVMHLLMATVFASGLLAPLMPHHFPGGAEASLEPCLGLVLDAICTQPGEVET
jgi:AcrR family transcriptional regulator